MDPVIRFVGNDFYGLPEKRSQVSRACTACRRRKVGKTDDELRHDLADQGSENVHMAMLIGTVKSQYSPLGQKHRQHFQLRHSMRILSLF
jgi:hypothetical protein